MRNSILTIILATFSFVAKGQDSTIGLSRFEKMATSTGNLYKFEEKGVGSVRGQSISMVKMVNYNGGDSSSVIRIAPAFWKTTPIIANAVLYIEKGEIGPVIKLLENYSDQMKANNPVASNYYSYITPNDIQILCRFDERVFVDTYLTISKLYQHLRTPVQNSTIYFNNKKDIDKLIQLLKEAEKLI